MPRTAAEDFRWSRSARIRLGCSHGFRRSSPPLAGGAPITRTFRIRKVHRFAVVVVVRYVYRIGCRSRRRGLILRIGFSRWSGCQNCFERRDRERIFLECQGHVTSCLFLEGLPDVCETNVLCAYPMDEPNKNGENKKKAKMEDGIRRRFSSEHDDSRKSRVSLLADFCLPLMDGKLTITVFRIFDRNGMCRVSLYRTSDATILSQKRAGPENTSFSVNVASRSPLFFFHYEI